MVEIPGLIPRRAEALVTEALADTRVVLVNGARQAGKRTLTRLAEERGRLHHHRTKDKREVDAVIETPDGRVIGVEVKAGATVRTEDLAGLRNLADHLGDRFIAGYVLYTGQQTLPLGEKIRALPLDALWRLAP